MKIENLENLEIIEIPQFKNGEIEYYKKGLSFILAGFHFSFYANESSFFEFFPSENHCKVQYRSVCFTLSNNNPTALQQKIKELEV